MSFHDQIHSMKNADLAKAHEYNGSQMRGGISEAMGTLDMLNPNVVIFVQVPLRTLLATPPIGRAVMGALFNAVIHADEGRQNKVLFQIEAWTLGAMKEIKLFHATARK